MECKICKLEAVVSIDQRGQIVLPKEIREKTDLKAGDKLAILSACDENGKVCCLIFLRAEIIEKLAVERLSPTLKTIFGGD
ncbi:MAG: HgcAB-associated protein [Archaeoglobales archaeon]|nr:HgcAB-associated protein [Archaeoglobales archaeon]